MSMARVSKVLPSAAVASRKMPPNAGKGRKRGLPNQARRAVHDIFTLFVECSADGAQGFYDRIPQRTPIAALLLHHVRRPDTAARRGRTAHIQTFIGSHRNPLDRVSTMSDDKSCPANRADHGRPTLRRMVDIDLGPHQISTGAPRHPRGRKIITETRKMSIINPEKTDHSLHISAADLLAKFPTSPERPQLTKAAPTHTHAPQPLTNTTNAGTFRLRKESDETPEQGMANAVLMPPVLAATSLHKWQHGFAGTGNEVDINHLLIGLVQHVKEVCDGSLRGLKSRLLMQSTVLDSIFFKLNIEAARNMASGGSLELSERLLKLAFRAQSQGRATDETLALLEHPKALFVRQMNNAAGHQQVVNARARKTKKCPNKLLDKESGDRLDAGTTISAGRSDTTVKTVGVLNRGAARQISKSISANRGKES
jgi:hypothetical protein